LIQYFSIPSGATISGFAPHYGPTSVFIAWETKLPDGRILTKTRVYDFSKRAVVDQFDFSSAPPSSAEDVITDQKIEQRSKEIYRKYAAPTP
jgi:hypothetical protein